MKMLSMLLSVLTAVAGVVAIFGITYDQHKRVSADASGIERVWTRLTPIGLVVLTCALLLCGLSIYMQILQSEREGDLQSRNEDFQSTTIYKISTNVAMTYQALTNVQRIVGRFESIAITAVYQVPLSQFATADANNLVRQLTNGPATGTNQGFPVWTSDLDDFLQNKKLTNSVRTRLQPLLTPAVLAELYRERDADKEVFRALAPRGTNVPVIEWLPASNLLTCAWEVGFPKSLWNQSRVALVPEDLCSTWLQVGFVAAPSSVFAELQARHMTLSCDEIAFLLTTPEPTGQTLEGRRTRVRLNAIKGNGAHKPASSSKAAAQARLYMEALKIPGHEDAQLGTIVCTHQARLPDQIPPAKAPAGE